MEDIQKASQRSKTHSCRVSSESATTPRWKSWVWRNSKSHWHQK